jgi:hypothetical protein
MFAAVEGQLSAMAIALRRAGDGTTVGECAVIGVAEIRRAEVARIGRCAQNPELRRDVIAEREERDGICC